MTWIVLSVLFVLAIGGSLFWFIVNDKGSDARIGSAVVAAGAVVVWLVMSVIMSVHTVGQLQVGLVYNFSGTLQHSTGHGVVWVAPWQNVKTENIGLQSVEFNLDANNSAVSQDQQQIFGDIQLNYEVEPTDVVHLYKTVGSSWKNVLLESRMLQDFKQVTSTYTAAQITTQRAALRSDTRTLMQKELQSYGIRVVDVLIKNLGYSPAYRDAITEKTIQVQKSLQAEAKVKQAEAEAQQLVAAAKGQAEAIRLQGQALRENPDYLQLQAIDKLAPQASVIICTGQTCPSFIPQAIVKAADTTGQAPATTGAKGK